jgi:hypothetical protein
MAYFPNGTAGECYEAQYCNHCVHQNGPDGESGCAVWLAHLLYSYRDCNDKDSILHLLIPRSKDGLSNEQCRLFARKKPSTDRVQLVDLLEDR